jgi:hypothetical protein
MTEPARLAVDELAAKLLQHGETRYTLDRTSSDLLLVLLLPRIGKWLAASQADVSIDGIARVRWIAERFVELQATENGKRRTDA